MSWAGKRTLSRFFRSLLAKKGQAPSSSGPAPFHPLPEAEFQHVEQLVQQWVDGKGYRLPDTRMSQAARRIGTDSQTLYRYFQSRGQDFRSWRTRLRIADAQEQLLQEPGAPASTVGRRVGIPDRSNFTRQFKDICGQTPESWRKSHKI